MIGDVLLPRELRYPADHWGRTAVVCGRSTFWMENAVPDLLGVPPHAGTAFRLARPCAPGWLLQMMTDGVVTDRVPYQGSARLRGRVATPRGPGRLGQGVCVLHEPPNPAEYTHLPISGTRPSCSTSSCHQKPSSRHMRPHHRPTRPLRSLRRRSSVSSAPSRPRSPGGCGRRRSPYPPTGGLRRRCRGYRRGPV